MNREYPEIPTELVEAWNTYQTQLSAWQARDPDDNSCDGFWSSYNPKIAEELAVRVERWYADRPTHPPCLDAVMAERQAIASANYELKERQQEQRMIDLRAKQAADAVERKEQAKIKAAATRAKTKLKKEGSKARLATLKLKPKP
jgi:hypothetical protein